MHYNAFKAKIQSLNFWKKPPFILALVLCAFFLKGVFLVTLYPIFVGQDETKHFNSVTFLAEPRPITWHIKSNVKKDAEGMQKGNYTEEILETSKAVNFDEEIKGELYNTLSFNDGFYGKNEAEINENKWKQYNENYPVNRADISLYHKLAAKITKTFSSQDLLLRYFLVRTFSVFLGTLTVLFSYLIAKNVGFSSKASLLTAAIVAFQPRFSIYTAAINYDILLILLFTSFTLGSILALKNGLNWKNFSLMAVSVYLGIQTKPTASVLLVVFASLMAYFAYRKIGIEKRKTKLLFISAIILVITALGAYFKKYIPATFLDLGTTIPSIGKYLSDSITPGKLGLSARTYWGTLTWVDSWSLDNITNFISKIESFAILGIILFLLPSKYHNKIISAIRRLYLHLKTKCTKKNSGQTKETAISDMGKWHNFLPEKKYVLFFILMIIALQLGIRFADWRAHGELGTPGRYFLPNIAAHIILVFTGIGALLRKEKYFEKSLIIGLILMMAFMLYIIFDVIIYRYYL